MLIPILKAALASYASDPEPEAPIGSPVFYEKMVVSIFLVLGGGVFAGHVSIVLNIWTRELIVSFESDSPLD